MKEFSQPLVLYQLGPAPHPVTLWVAKCKNDERQCDVLGDGRGQLLFVATPELVLSEAMLYDTLLSVCLMHLMRFHLFFLIAIRNEVLGVSVV